MAGSYWHNRPDARGAYMQEGSGGEGEREDGLEQCPACVTWPQAGARETPESLLRS